MGSRRYKAVKPNTRSGSGVRLPFNPLNIHENPVVQRASDPRLLWRRWGRAPFEPAIKAANEADNAIANAITQLEAEALRVAPWVIVTVILVLVFVVTFNQWMSGAALSALQPKRQR